MLRTRSCHACKHGRTPPFPSVTSHPENPSDPPRLFFRAQGAAQAFEDAGVLGAIFAESVTRDQIPDALRVFEEVRKPRASSVRHRTLDQKAMFALADGPSQEERDARFRAGADHDLFKWLWEYDATESGREAWKELVGTRWSGVGVGAHNGMQERRAPSIPSRL